MNLLMSMNTLIYSIELLKIIILIIDMKLNPVESFLLEKSTRQQIKLLFKCLKKMVVDWKIEVTPKKNLITF